MGNKRDLRFRTLALGLTALAAAVTALAASAGAVTSANSGGDAGVAAAVAAGSSSLDPRTLSHARAIKAGITPRYVRPEGPKLAVTEASSTGVIESYLLLTPDLLGLRVVPADNGIYYAICPARATCPYPAPRLARPPSAFLPRRQALELALRTFLETSADVVAVSLPTRDFVFFLIERGELDEAVDMAALARALSGNPARAPAASLRRIVDEITRPRLFVPIGLEPTPNGRDSLGAAPLWREGSNEVQMQRERRDASAARRASWPAQLLKPAQREETT